LESQNPDITDPNKTPPAISIINPKIREKHHKHLNIPPKIATKPSISPKITIINKQNINKPKNSDINEPYTIL
jgi:hypothetical protein